MLARHDSATPDRRAIVVRTRHSLAACQRGAHLQQMQMPMHFLLVATVLAAANAFVPSPTKQLARRRAQPRQSASSMKVLRAALPHAHRPPWHCASSCAPAFCSAALPSACVQSHPAKFSAGMSGKGLLCLGYADRVQCRRRRCAARGQIRWGEDGLEQLARTAAGGREFGRGDQTDGRS